MDRSVRPLFHAEAGAATADLGKIEIHAAIRRERIDDNFRAQGIVACAAAMNHQARIRQIHHAVRIEGRARAPGIIDVAGQSRVLIKRYALPRVSGARGRGEARVAACPLPFGKLIELA